MGVSTLIFKTALILGLQLLILLGCVFWLIYDLDGPCSPGVSAFKKKSGMGFVSSSVFYRMRITCAQSEKSRWYATLGFLSSCLIAFTLSKQGLSSGLLGMTLMSVAAAPLLARMMIDADQVDGKRSLKIVILSVGGLGLLGLQYPSESSIPWHIITVGLGFLFLGRGAMLLIRLGYASRFSAVSGVLIFLGIVLLHFQGLAALETFEGSAWKDAAETAVDLYFKVWTTIPLMLE